MATNVNMTTSSGLAAGANLTVYNRNLLKTFEPVLAHLRFGDEHPFPHNEGTKMSFRKLLPLEADTTTLAEGEPGDAQMIAEVEVTAEIGQYGKYIYTTDKLDMTHFDLNLDRKVTLLGNQGRLSIDTVVRDELATCTNVIYAGGKTSRSALTAADVCTARDIRKGVRTLKNSLAMPFEDGYFVALVNPNVTFDLQDDEDWKKVSQNQDKVNIYSGEVAKLFGCRFVETTNAKIFEGAGSGGADVASIIILGRYAFGYSSLTGANPRVIVKQHGSSGTNDPLDQVASVGWKMDGFAVKLLQPEFAVRIECGMSA